MPVCQAIQHAHQKGIIHRDIKPSNVLVALYDGRPVPKVIDFGVAKATGPAADRQDAVHRHSAQVVGTPEYMSPEQAELNKPGHRHPHRRLLARRAALRTADRHARRSTRKQLEQGGAAARCCRIVREEEPPQAEHAS